MLPGMNHRILRKILRLIDVYDVARRVLLNPLKIARLIVFEYFDHNRHAWRYCGGGTHLNFAVKNDMRSNEAVLLKR